MMRMTMLMMMLLWLCGSGSVVYVCYCIQCIYYNHLPIENKKENKKQERNKNESSVSSQRQQHRRVGGVPGVTSVIWLFIINKNTIITLNNNHTHQTHSQSYYPSQINLPQSN